MDKITELVAELCRIAHCGVIDLRYTPDGEWCVMMPMGNIMVVVPGSIRTNLVESLEYCLKRWENRSSLKPFWSE